MKFTLTRNTGFVGKYANLDVFINGQSVGFLKREETRDFTFEGDVAELRVGQGFVKSEPILVKDRDIVFAKSSFLHLIMSGTLLFFFFFYKKVFYLELK